MWLSLVSPTVLDLDQDTNSLWWRAPFDFIKLALDGLIHARLKPVATHECSHTAALSPAVRIRVPTVNGNLF